MDGSNRGKGMGKGRNEVFGLGWALLNGYGGIVNGSLIHANQLAFGGTECYLCIEAAPGQMVSLASWHERLGATIG